MTPGTADPLDLGTSIASFKVREHPGEEIPDAHVFTQPWLAEPSSNHGDQLIYYRCKADRARRTLFGIDEQVAKAAKTVAGLAPGEAEPVIAFDDAVKSVNRQFEAKARDLAGLKGYATNLAACPDGTPDILEAYAKPSEAVPSAACLRRSESFLIIFMGSFA